MRRALQTVPAGIGHPAIPGCISRLYRVAMASTRLDFAHTAPAVNRALVALAASVDLDQRLGELVKIRASQLNGCSCCVDLHARDARAEGEDERRIWGVAAWRHHVLFDER